MNYNWVNVASLIDWYSQLDPKGQWKNKIRLLNFEENDDWLSYVLWYNRQNGYIGNRPFCTDICVPKYWETPC